jgi:hypothetical protein
MSTKYFTWPSSVIIGECKNCTLKLVTAVPPTSIFPSLSIHSCLTNPFKQSPSHVTTDGLSVSLGVEPHPGLMTRFWIPLTFTLCSSSVSFLTRDRVCHVSEVLVLSSSTVLKEINTFVVDRVYIIYCYVLLRIFRSSVTSALCHVTMQ